MVSADKYRAFNSTCIGAAHIRANKECQDASLSAKGKGYTCGCVCDGHGGEDYFRSATGARLAAELFVSGVCDTDFLKSFRRARGDNEKNALLAQFVKSLITRWNIAVEADLAANPLSLEELLDVSDKARKKYLSGEHLSGIYGTTFIGFAFIGGLCFGLQIGDGKCLALDSAGVLFEPIADDEECFLNVTTSLSSENAYQKFRIFAADEGSPLYPRAVFMCTDGVTDSFSAENLCDFCSLALKNLNAGESESELFDYLPTLSAKGSGDDMSVCILLDRGE